MIQRHDGVRMDGSGHVHVTKSGPVILVSVLIFILFLHIRDERGQVEYILEVFIPLHIPLYIPNNH